VLMCLAAGLLAFVVQSGEVGSSDTTLRLQAAHSLWTSQPESFPGEFAPFGLPGRDGRFYCAYGVGQSLLMLPADVLGTWIASWPVFAEYEDDPAVRSIVVSYTTNVLLCVLTALVASRFLQQLGFARTHAILGSLALLAGTTRLHYAQNMMENGYIMLLTLAGFSYQYEWARTGSRRALAVGSAAFGLNLLTRLTTGLDLVAGGVFVSLTLWFEGRRGRDLGRRLLAYGRGAAPVYAVFGFLDRAYQFHRFGSWTNTYLSIGAKRLLEQDPTLPAGFPWNTPLHVGVLGALFAPEKSIFLFDPLIVLAIGLVAWRWRRLGAGVRAYAASTLLLLAGYVVFYARFTSWAGDFAWGDRYASTAVELAALLGVPLLLHHRETLGRAARWAGGALVVVSLAIQLASLAFWLPLEIYQEETLGHPTFVVALRFRNIVAFSLGKMQAWGLDAPAMHEDPWDYVHITTWNVLPFLLRRVGVAPAWVVDLAFAAWLAAIAALAAVCWRLARVLRLPAASG
jgi:hypothetical protein